MYDWQKSPVRVQHTLNTSSHCILLEGTLPQTMCFLTFSVKQAGLKTNNFVNSLTNFSLTSICELVTHTEITEN